MLLLKANPELKKVFERLIGTVKAPVTWTGVFAVANNNLVLVGELRSLIFNFNNKKVYTNIMDIPLENKKTDIIPNDALINNMLNVTLYAFGKWGSIGGLKVEKDYAALNQLFMAIFRTVGVEAEFRTENFRFYKNGIQITYEEVLQAAMELLKNEGKVQEEEEEEAADKVGKKDFEDTEKAGEEDSGNTEETRLDEEQNTENVAEKEETKTGDDHGTDVEEEYELGLWHKLCWKMAQAEFARGTQSEEDLVKSRIGHNFYMTDYICPECGEKLYAGVYPVDHELLIETEEARVFIARAYTCASCHTFYTPRPEKLLQEGDVYRLSFGEDNIAYQDYLDVLGERAAKTSNYKMNEYESERGKKKTAPAMEETQGSGEEAGKEAGKDDRQAALQQGAKAPTEIKWTMKGAETAASGESAGSRAEVSKAAGHESLKSEERTMQFGKKQLKKEQIEQEQLKKERMNEEKAVKEESVKAESVKEKASGQEAVMERTKAKLSAKTTEELKAILNAFGEKIYSPATGIGRVSVPEAHRPHVPQDTTPEIYLRAVRETYNDKMNAKINARMSTLDKLAANQLSELRGQIEEADFLAKEDKADYIGRIDDLLYSEEEKFIEQRVELGRNRTYDEINRIIEEIEKRDCPDELKKDAVHRLIKMRENRAEREVEHLILNMPLHLDRKQLSVYLDKLNQYKEVDLTPYQKQLERRRDLAEKEEIAAFVKRGGKKDRQTLWELYGQINGQDYKEENKAPFLEKIYDKIRSMDEAKIEEVCPSVVSLSFEDGLKAYEEIEQMMLLPELKVNTLEMIERRLTKLKTDESVQLMRKLRHDLEEKIPNLERFYFYDAREEGRHRTEEPEDGGESKEKAAMYRAINGYGAARSAYEYPLLVGDISKNANGKEGFVLTPDHIFYRTLFGSGTVAVTDIEKVAENKGLFGKGIYLHRITGKKVKMPNPAGKESNAAFTAVMDEFVAYLQEKPESRSVSYLAKDKHDVKCCYRCGYTYKGGNVCPRCGSKMNN